MSIAMGRAVPAVTSVSTIAGQTRRGVPKRVVKNSPHHPSGNRRAVSRAASRSAAGVAPGVIRAAFALDGHRVAVITGAVFDDTATTTSSTAWDELGEGADAAVTSAKLAYGAVVYSFAEDGTAIGRTDLSQRSTTIIDPKFVAAADAAETAAAAAAQAQVVEGTILETTGNSSGNSAIISENDESFFGEPTSTGNSAYSADEVLCLKYGVDQDKEEAKYKVAFFDMDAVVGADDTLSFVTAAATKARVEKLPAWLRFLAGPLFALIRLLQKKADDGEFADFKGLSALETDTEALAQKVYDEHIKERVFPEAARTVKQLKYDGYKIVLITACPDFIAKPLGRALGCSRVISPVLEADTGADGVPTFTGRLEGGALTAEEKRERVLAFAKEVGVDMRKSIAYGRRSAQDLPLMECVGKAYAVSPDEGLRTKAAAEGWQVLSWAGDKDANVTVSVSGVAGSIPAPSPQPVLAFAGAASSAAAAPTNVPPPMPKNPKSNPWMMRDPDQYDDTENRSRSRQML